MIAPLFFHCMHKLGWAVSVVQAESEHQRQNSHPPTADEIRQDLASYLAAKGPNPLALDRDQFLYLLKTKPGANVTSVQRAFAKQLFDDHVEAELEKLLNPATTEGVSRRMRKLSYSESFHLPGQPLVGQIEGVVSGPGATVQPSQ